MAVLRQGIGDRGSETAAKALGRFSRHATFSWLPREDAIARASEALVLAYNPRWTTADWDGEISFLPKWSIGHFKLQAMFVFDEPIPFTRESWRGRMRACRAVGATLGPDQVDAFDREHEDLLKSIAGEDFAILHRIDAHLFQPV